MEKHIYNYILYYLEGRRGDNLRNSQNGDVIIWGMVEITLICDSSGWKQTKMTEFSSYACMSSAGYFKQTN